MPDAAFHLAALRASRVRTLASAELEEARKAASGLGRRLVAVGDRTAEGEVVLGWQDGHEPSPEGYAFSVRRLSQVPLVALGICLGLCWSDRRHQPFPGEPASLEEVEAVAARLGVNRAHLVGALRHDLSLSYLVSLDWRVVRLGPAVAAWTPSQIDALRRFADVLPMREAG